MRIFAKLAFVCVAILASGAQAETQREAALFGLRSAVSSVSLSPDGTKIAFIAASKGPASIAMVASTSGGKPAQVAYSAGEPWRLQWCDWATNERLVCELYGINDSQGPNLPFTRLMAFDLDGGNVVELGKQSRMGIAYARQFDGRIIGWDTGEDNGDVLMARYYVPEQASGFRVASKLSGLGVDVVDTQSGDGDRLEFPKPEAFTFLADDNGQVRIMGEHVSDRRGRMIGITKFSYRLLGDDQWRPFSTLGTDDEAGMHPLAIDTANNAVFAVSESDGRDALYRVSLDGSMKSELLLAHDKVDVSGLLRLGSRGRIIGVTWTTDERQTKYFDADLGALVEGLSAALPGNPHVSLVSADATEDKLLVFATDDTEPGRYYIFDRTTRALDELMLSRPVLQNVALAQVRPVSYESTDGTSIPAYLTLPPGGPNEDLPAIVMPHGGPAARDSVGFDWWAQYFAARGYAVLQPNYRGSSGYGDEWYVNNGFQSWDVAMEDINAGAAWLVEQGVADPRKLAIVGWSYGGYAALQANVVAPDLYQAVIAVAPVTDLELLIEDSRGFTNYRVTQDFVGSGPHVEAGSPRRHAAKIKAPVLMFSGNKDLNVDIRHAKAMEEALAEAGKDVELVVYEGLDHGLPDSNARTDMLQQSDDFLRKHLGL